MRPPVALALLLCASPVLLRAQSERLPVAQRGQAVVLTTYARKIVRGDLMGVKADTVFVSRGRGGVTALLRREVTRTQMQGPPTRMAGAGRGAKVGAVVGLLLGVWGAAQGDKCTSGGEDVECPAALKSSGPAGVFLAVVAVGAGALAGMVVGSAFPTDSWVDAQLPEASAGDTAWSPRCGAASAQPVAFNRWAAFGGSRC